MSTYRRYLDAKLSGLLPLPWIGAICLTKLPEIMLKIICDKQFSFIYFGFVYYIKTVIACGS